MLRTTTRDPAVHGGRQAAGVVSAHRRFSEVSDWTAPRPLSGIVRLLVQPRRLMESSR